MLLKLNKQNVIRCYVILLKCKNFDIQYFKRTTFVRTLNFGVYYNGLKLFFRKNYVAFKKNHKILISIIKIFRESMLNKYKPFALAG